MENLEKEAVHKVIQQYTDGTAVSNVGMAPFG